MIKSALAKLVVISALIFIPTLALQSTVSAVDVFKPCATGAGASDACKDANSQGNSGKNPVVSAVKVIIQVVALIIGIAAIIIIIISGIRMVTSGGDPQAVAGARSGILYAVVGIIIALVAQALVAFVLSKL